MQSLTFESLALEKIYGAEVPFTDYREIADSEPVPAGYVAGALRYQYAPATIDEATYDAFVAGNMQDIATAIESAHPVKVLYMKFSWNASGLNITDLQIAIIFKVLSGSVSVNDIAATMRTVPWYEDMRNQGNLGPNTVWIFTVGIGIDWLLVAGIGAVVIVSIGIAVALTR